jgi:hypothetical protein
VISPFNACMATPLVPTVHGIYADGDMVVILFEASAPTKDDRLFYHNTCTWYFQMKEGKVVKAIAFFDTREFDEFWTRVAPTKWRLVPLSNRSHRSFAVGAMSRITRNSYDHPGRLQ